MELRPNTGHGILILEVSRSHTVTHHSQQDSYGWVISLLQRPLTGKIQHSQETNIHVPGGIRTHGTSKWAAAVPTPQTAWLLGLAYSIMVT